MLLLLLLVTNFSLRHFCYRRAFLDIHFQYFLSIRIHSIMFIREHSSSSSSPSSQSRLLIFVFIAREQQFRIELASISIFAFWRVKSSSAWYQHELFLSSFSVFVNVEHKKDNNNSISRWDAKLKAKIMHFWSHSLTPISFSVSHTHQQQQPRQKDVKKVFFIYMIM
jgi:hypothetical protein